MRTQPYAVVGNLGKCKVLAYVGDDTFRVLRLRNGSSYRVKRDQMQFLPTKGKRDGRSATAPDGK